MRIHAFLERHGLINFSVAPDQKPLSKDLLKEVTYNKVFINAANKHFLEKNENEYLNNLFEVSSVQTSAESPHDQSLAQPKRLVDAATIRKLNLLTCKQRPTCSFCCALVGFSWRSNETMTLCEKCFQSG